MQEKNCASTVHLSQIQYKINTRLPHSKLQSGKKCTDFHYIICIASMFQWVHKHLYLSLPKLYTTITTKSYPSRWERMHDHTTPSFSITKYLYVLLKKISLYNFTKCSLQFSFYLYNRTPQCLIYPPYWQIQQPF